MDKRLVLGTADGTSKKDLRLTDAAFPVPIVFIPGKFTIDGTPVMAPETWVNNRTVKTNNEAKIATIITFEEFQHAKKARKQ